MSHPPTGAAGPKDSKTDELLLARASAGDGGAWLKLHRLHKDRVYSLVRRIVGDDDDADDCAQEAWIRAARALRRFRGDSRFSTWIHTIAVNTALQWLRKHKSRGARETRMTEHVELTARAKPMGGDVLLRRRLQEAMDLLPEGMRVVLIMHDVEGWTHQQIAERLGVAEGTSKSQLFKARAKMRRMLQGLSDEVAHGNEGVEAWGI